MRWFQDSHWFNCAIISIESCSEDILRWKENWQTTFGQRRRSCQIPAAAVVSAGWLLEQNAPVAYCQSLHDLVSSNTNYEID